MHQTGLFGGETGGNMQETAPFMYVITIGGIMKKLLFSIILAVAMATGCASAPQNPAQAVYVAHGTYTVALTAAVNYKRLPACGKPTSPPLCSKPEVVAQLQKADDVAFTALQAAQRIIRAPDASATTIQTALFNANQAIAAFEAIAKTLGVK